MSSWVRKLVAPPFFEEDEAKTQTAEFANIILLASLAIILIASPALIYFSPTHQARVMSGVLVAAFVALLLGALILLHRGLVRLTSLFLVGIFWASVTALIFFFGGLRTAGVGGYLLAIFIAALVLGGRGALVVGLLCMVSAAAVFCVYYFDPPVIPPGIEALTSSRTHVGFDDLFTLFALSALMAVLLWLVRRSIANTLDRALGHERTLAEINRELQASRDALQKRTQELERRAVRLRAAAEVTRGTTATRGLDDLLERAVNIVRDRFGFYHAGVFLVDERGEYAVLRMATGEAGRKMLEQGHRLEVGEGSIVGYVTATGEPRIALDVGTDAVHFKNPLLPETRSEMALPLRVGRRIIGALDVQSREEAAFDEDDAAILQTMADQLAVAIENARLLAQMQQTVRELEAASGRYTQESWRGSIDRPLGYRYRRMDIEPSDEQTPEVREAWRQGSSIVTTAQPQVEGDGQDTVSVAAIPIKLRGQVIGVLSLRSTGKAISSSAVARVEEVAGRLAIALENARLLEETQRRASREQMLGGITARFTRSLDMDTLLRSAVRELGQLPNVAEASVHVGAPGEVAAPGGGEQATGE